MSGSLADELRAVTNWSGDIRRVGEAVGPNSSAQGFYRLLGCREDGDIFLKIVSKSQAERQIRADRVARHAAAAGIETNLLLPGFPKPFADNLDLLAYPYLEGGPPDTSPKMLADLGHALGRLHRQLADSPFSQEVRAEAEVRHQMLDRRLKTVLSSGIAPGPYPKRLLEILAAWPTAFSDELPRSQVIHGDLNPGNLLVRSRDGAIVFLDFEDSLSAWLPPCIDLAFVLERLVLLREADDDAAVTRGQAFLAAYGETAGTVPVEGRGELGSALRWLHLRSLCLLAEFEAMGTPWPIEEWQKFQELIELAGRRGHVIRAIQEPFLA